MTSSVPRRLCLAAAMCLVVPGTAGAQKLITAPGPGTPSAVRVIDASGSDQSFLVYDPGFLGGVRVAQGDVNGDGVPDIVTAAGPGGGPQVRVWNGTDLTEIGGFTAYDATFTGGVFVTTGDVNGDGRADIITGAGTGGAPRVRIWDAATFTEIAGFDAYDSTFQGGVTVAAADVDGDGLADIVTGTGPGGGPRVRVWNGATRAELGSFDAYNSSFEGGVNVAAGDIDGDGLADILTGAGPGGTPQVRAWRGADFTAIGEGFAAYEPGFSGGIAVGVVDVDADGVNEIVTGPMTGSPLVRVWTGTTTFTLVGEYVSSDPGAGPGGTAIASESEDHSRGNLRFVSATETTFAVGSPGTFTVRTKGGAKPALTVSGALPAGVTFVDNGNRTATLAGTPAAGTGGTYPLVFTADNGSGTPVTQNFTLIVGQGPAITSANATTFTVGVAGTFTVTTTGTPAPTITATGTLPSAVTFTDNGNGTATLAGTPAAGTAGTYPLTITATNSGGSATQNFTLTVELACPTITITPAVMPDGFYQTVYVGVDFNQTGSTGSSFTWGATGLPAGLTIEAATGVVSGTPTTTVLNAAVVVTVTDNFGCSGTLNTAITVRPFTDNDTYNGGVGNTQFAVGVAGIATPTVFVNDNVKNGDNGPGTLMVTFNAPASGSVTEGPTDGTFIYTPNVAFAGPSDSFTYTLTDGNGVTNTGTVTINLSNIVWYVNSAGGNGDGRSHTPFNTLSNAAAPSASNSFIYVHTGAAGGTTGNLAMDTSQTLHGQGVAFALNGLTIAAGAPPTLIGTVTLANNTVVTGVNFTPSAIPAMTGSGITGPVMINQVNVTGGTTALSLTNVSGAVTVSSANFTNTSAAELLISGGTGAVTLNPTVTISSNAGRSIDIQNRTGGTVTLSGPITDTSQGVFLNANTGSTIDFSGGLSLTTTTNPGFTATGGGTVSATQNNTTIVNTITTTTGTALNVASTTIGASRLTFRSISAAGGTNGIILSNTGTSGGLTVTGNGGTCTNANTAGCSGGQISNTLGADDSGTTPVGTGIVLNNTTAPSLTRMWIHDHSNYAIRGTTVVGLTLANVVVNGTNGTNVAGPFNEGSIRLTELTGAATISNSAISGAAGNNLAVVNTAGTLDRLTVSGTTFGAMSATTGESALNVESLNDAVINMTVENSVFTAARGNHIARFVNSSSASDTVITGNTISNTGVTPVAGGGAAIRIVGGNNTGQNASATFNVSNNTMRDSLGTALAVNKLGGTGTWSGTVADNAVGVAGVSGSGSAEGSGIFVLSDGGGTYTVSITGNTVRQFDNDGIFVQTGGSGVTGNGAMNVTVTGNTVTDPEPQVPGNLATNGFHLNGGTTPGDTYQICLHLSGNTLAGAGQDTIPPGSTFGDFRLRQRQSTTVRLPGYGGGATDVAAVVTFIEGQNPGATGVASTSSPPGGGFVGGAACPTP